MAEDMHSYSRGDVAEVEGRLAVLIREGKQRGRWDWMDGTWTTIPLSVGPVLFNVYDHALPPLSGDRAVCDHRFPDGTLCKLTRAAHEDVPGLASLHRFPPRSASSAEPCSLPGMTGGDQ